MDHETENGKAVIPPPVPQVAREATAVVGPKTIPAIPVQPSRWSQWKLRVIHQMNRLTSSHKKNNTEQTAENESATKNTGENISLPSSVSNKQAVVRPAIIKRQMQFLTDRPLLTCVLAISMVTAVFFLVRMEDTSSETTSQHQEEPLKFNKIKVMPPQPNPTEVKNADGSSLEIVSIPPPQNGHVVIAPAVRFGEGHEPEESEPVFTSPGKNNPRPAVSSRSAWLTGSIEVIPRSNGNVRRISHVELPASTALP